MTCSPPPSETVRKTAFALVRRLRHRDNADEFLAALDLARELGVSPPTVHRALRWLRAEYQAPLEYDRGGCGWRLARDWHPVLEVPDVEDVAVLRTLEQLGRDGAWPAVSLERLTAIREALERKLAEGDG